MKKGLLLLGAFLMLVSCSEYQKVLKSKDTGKKYTFAEDLYNQAIVENSKSKFRKALRVFEQIVPEYRGKPQGEKLTFLYADTYYQLKDNQTAAYQFERFVASYPNSDKVEEATFKSARSYYMLSPRFDLDQADTFKAIDELQKYIDKYPNGEFVDQANEYGKELRVKLEKKSYEIAKQYHHTENYKSAIVAFNNFILEYPGSPFREAAFFYRLESSYLLAINSYEDLQKDRLNTAKGYYNNYNKYYPEGSVYYNQSQTQFQDIDSRLQNF